MFNFKKQDMKSANLFVSGLALGTVGLKILTSKDAKKVYANVVAAGIRAKDSVMATADKVQASADDILAEAKEINDNRQDNFLEEKTGNGEEK